MKMRRYVGNDVYECLINDRFNLNCPHAITYGSGFYCQEERCKFKDIGELETILLNEKNITTNPPGQSKRHTKDVD